MPRTSSTTYALLVLFAINAMNFYDRQVLGPLVGPIKNEFDLTDTAVGGLGTAFVLLYAFVGVPLGRLTDYFNRTRILTVGVFFWSVMTAAQGIAISYWQLFAARLAVGVGEASCAPAASSLIGDYFPASGRARAMSIFMMGLPVGIALSFIVSAYVAASLGWRAALFVALVPGLICALLTWWMAEPERGATELKGVGKRRREGSPYWVVLSIPTIWWIIASGALHNFNMYALGTFLHEFLVRTYELDISAAGWVAAITYGIVGAPGLLLGGYLGDMFHRRRASGRMLVGACALGAATPLLYFALGSPVWWQFALLLGTGCMLMYVYYSTVYATIQDVIEPALRGTAMALYFFAMYVLGAASGPYVMGYLSDRFARSAAAADGVSLSGLEGASLLEALKPYAADGLHSALYAVPILCALLTVVLFAGAWTVSGDVEKLQKWMRSHAE